MKEITESNNLICVFMADDPEAYLEGELRYHESWNQLMPVVEKIESLGYMVTMQAHQCQVFTMNGNWPEEMIIDADFRKNRLDNTYEGVVSFIQWYNQQQIDK